MKLSADETRKLIRECDGAPIAVVIDDACEMLMLKVVLFIKNRVGDLKAEMETLKPGARKRQDIAYKINALNKLIVELAEAK